MSPVPESVLAQDCATFRRDCVAGRRWNTRIIVGAVLAVGILTITSAWGYSLMREHRYGGLSERVVKVETRTDGIVKSLDEIKRSQAATTSVLQEIQIYIRSTNTKRGD